MINNYQPRFVITPLIARCLMRIEAVKQSIAHLPFTPALLKSLRETARLFTTHYSTMIEGNLLTQEQVVLVVKDDAHFPGRQRDEFEVKGYYTALSFIEQWSLRPNTISENQIQLLHAYVMSGGKTRVKPSDYRDGQNVIRDSASHKIVYMPPEAHDVPQLMRSLVNWLNTDTDLPLPLKAAIAHYQFATIHPYFDGNGRTARLLTTLILHQGGYDLKGIYSLEEYYARHLSAYYAALNVGPSHNYYLGRADADITQWLEYFCQGMAEAFENVQRQAIIASRPKNQDQSTLLRKLDARQRKSLELFQEQDTITAKEIAALFSFKPRTSSAICNQWVESGFLAIVDPSKKARRYKLGKRFAATVKF
jgi:Fic family protein